MNKSFLTLKGNVGSEVMDTSTAFATLVGRFLNRRYFQVLRTINWKNINPDYTFNTVVGQQNYVLPEDFGKEISCSSTTTKEQISKFQLDELYGTYKDLNVAGIVERYAVIDSPVQAQPTASSVLAVVSSSASDTTQTVVIRGISGGVEMIESVTLTGTSSVNTTNAYTRVKAISKSASTTGKVTVTSNSAAVTLAVLSPEMLTASYKLAVLHYKPSELITIAMPYIIKPLPMTNDYDFPVIDIGDLLEIGAIADALRYKRQFAKANSYEIMFTQQLNDYIFDKENDPNEIKQFTPYTYTRDYV